MEEPDEKVVTILSLLPITFGFAMKAASSALADPNDTKTKSATRACLQLRRERIGIGRRTFCVSDARGIPESANV
jgi:hypothetical protein